MRVTWILPLAVLALSGCKLFVPIPDREADPVTVSNEPIVADCQVVEFDNLGRESANPRTRKDYGVNFAYTTTQDVPAGLAGPKHVFLMSHGWMNSIQEAREFSAKLIKGILARAQKDDVKFADLAFVAVSWNSERGLFHESALNAEAIGKNGIAPLLASIKSAHPDLSVTLIGHSLGGRLLLSSLQASSALAAANAVLLEAAADKDALVPTKSEGFGAFPQATMRVGHLVSVHSSQDDVLRITYTVAMQSPALGREGADRDASGAKFPSLQLDGSAVSEEALKAAFADPAARAGGLVINVDASAIVSGHSEVFVPAVFDLIWTVASM